MQRHKCCFRTLLLLVLLGSGCGREENRQSPVEVQNLRYQEWSDGTRIVTGVIRNRTDQPIASLQLEVGLYDRDNRLVGTMYILVQDIPQRGRKRFRHVVDAQKDVQGVRIRSVLMF